MALTPLDRVRSSFFTAQNRFEYLSTLGHGGMGVVFKAFDRDLESDVAVKVMLRGVDLDGTDAVSRFKREIQLNRKIKHPNVARIFDFGMAEGIPYVTMEFVPGRSLHDIIVAEQRVTASWLLPVLRQTTLGIAEAHKLGIIHRDIKPQNIMVDDSGAVAILDFGLARHSREKGPIRDDESMGTPHYMAPEQAKGEPLDPRSDLFSLGIVAFRALTGELPFNGPTPLATIMAILSQSVPEEKLAEAEVPADLSYIVLKCLAKEPSHRYQSAEQLAMSLALASQAEWLDEEAGSDAAAVSEPPHAAGNEAPRILIVDGDRESQNILKLTLTASGCDVALATDGEGTLQFLHREACDLVLMDVKMRGLDGFDTTRILKTQEQFARLPVLLMATNLDRGRIAFAIQSGATDVVTKPIDLPPTIEKIWTILSHLGFSRTPIAGTGAPR